MKRLATLFLIILGGLAALIVGLWGYRIVLANNQAQDTPLKQLVLQSDELPVGTQWVTSGPITVDDPRNPLRPPIQVGEFSEAYQVFALSPVQVSDREAMVPIPIVNLVYRYSTETQAIAQWEQIVASLQKDPPGQIDVIYDGTQQTDRSVRAVGVQFVGSEGDVIYWFAGVKGDVVILLTLDDMQTFNGAPTPSGRALFEAVMTRLLRR